MADRKLRIQIWVDVIGVNLNDRDAIAKVVDTIEAAVDNSDTDKSWTVVDIVKAPEIVDIDE